MLKILLENNYGKEDSECFVFVNGSLFLLLTDCHHDNLDISQIKDYVEQNFYKEFKSLPIRLKGNLFK
jgi:hypothetical protein